MLTLIAARVRDFRRAETARARRLSDDLLERAMVKTKNATDGSNAAFVAAVDVSTTLTTSSATSSAETSAAIMKIASWE